MDPEEQQGTDKNKRALVIEDGRQSALLLKAILHNNFSMEVEIAEDCASARRMLSSSDFDVITLDHQLPDGLGLDLLKEITDEEDHPPVISVTGHGDEKTAAQYIQSGASSYVIKDTKLTSSLIAAVEKALAERELNRYREHLEELVTERTRELEEANQQLRREIAERKLAREELLRLNRELEGYAQTVSHDLRTPLTTVKLAGEALQRILEKRGDLDDAYADIVRVGDIIKTSAEQAEELIENLLELARAGQKPEEVLLVDISRVVERVLGEHEIVIEEKGAEFQVDDDLGRIRANPTHIYQLFSNIIGNAIKHNDNATPVVEIRQVGQGGAGKHRYRIRDNGPGIGAEDIENIFLPFFRGKTGNSGVGLAIVEKIVNLYDGEIEVYNNGGACFEFLIKDWHH